MAFRVRTETVAGGSTAVTYHVAPAGDAPQERLRSLVAPVDEIAEIPDSLRHGTPVRRGEVRIG